MGRKGGRPSKFTPEVRKVIVETVGTGAPRCHAADRAGVDRSSLWAWLARGKKDKKGEYFEFFNAVKKAEADAVVGSVARIRKAAVGGQVLERITNTVTTRDRNGKTTTKTTVTERLSQGQWTADAWLLERRHPKEFAVQRKKDMQLAMKEEFEKALKEGRIKLPVSDAPGSYSFDQLKTIALEAARKAKLEYHEPDPPLPPPEVVHSPEKSPIEDPDDE